MLTVLLIGVLIGALFAAGLPALDTEIRYGSRRRRELERLRQPIFDAGRQRIEATGATAHLRRRWTDRARVGRDPRGSRAA